MSGTYTGRCACGEVTLAIAGEPVLTRQCWCRQCRRIAAGGPANNAAFRTQDVAIHGTLERHAYVAASGNTLTQWFCPSCGIHLTAQSSARPHLLTVRFGVIDEPHGLKPTAAIWTEDAPAWATVDPAMEQFAQQPPVTP
ncbi:MAG: GFA family protein [Novosphingobium sp.]